MALPRETVHLGAEPPEGERLQVLSTPAGWYLGYLEDGMPYSRETQYFGSQEEAQAILERYIAALQLDDEDELTTLALNYWR